jgi:hypothetical protein
MAVAFPLRTPVMDVVRVIAGVVVGFATVPARPFADTTETLVTDPVPEDGVYASHAVLPALMRIDCPAAGVTVV